MRSLRIEKAAAWRWELLVCVSYGCSFVDESCLIAAVVAVDLQHSMESEHSQPAPSEVPFVWQVAKKAEISLHLVSSNSET